MAYFVFFTIFSLVCTLFMTRSFLLLLLLLSSLHPALAQEEEEPRKGLYVSEIGLYLGGLSNQIGGIGDYFGLLAPTSEFLQADLSGFRRTTWYGSAGSPQLGAYLGLQSRQRSGWQPLYRIGINYNPTRIFQELYSKESSFRFDTLTSNQSGAELFIDSTRYQSYTFNFHSQQFRIDCSVLLMRPVKKQTTLFIGLGAQFGIGFNQTRLEYYENREAKYFRTDGSRFFVFNNEISNTQRLEERFNNQLSQQLMLYLPFGLNYRLSTNNAFLNRFQLHLGFTTGFILTHFPEIGNFSQRQFGSSLGFRYKI